MYSLKMLFQTLLLHPGYGQRNLKLWHHQSERKENKNMLVHGTQAITPLHVPNTSGKTKEITSCMIYQEKKRTMNI